MNIPDNILLQYSTCSMQLINCLIIDKEVVNKFILSELRVRSHYLIDKILKNPSEENLKMLHIINLRIKNLENNEKSIEIY